MPLPYPGFSWTFTQHAIAYEPRNLFGLLHAAALVTGREDVRDEINRNLRKNRILTENLREGRGPDAWRDYQQVLPELGLLYSTALLPPITLTAMGCALLDGLLGYSELLTTQALRYQYPNGFKSMSPSLRNELRNTPYANEDSLIDLQARTGVLIKPGVIVLQTLLALHDIAPLEASLTTSEIQHYLVPLHHLDDGLPDPNAIIRNRRRRTGLALNGNRRNVQDWMSFLGRTDLFVFTEDHRLVLSQTTIRNRDRVRALLDYHSNPESYWVPADDSDNTRISWFDHFGSVSVSSQWVLLDTDMTSKYEKRNYLRGRDDDAEISTTAEDALETQYSSIGAQLRDIHPNLNVPQRRLVDFVPPDVAQLEERYAKTEKAKSLHARMVAELAAKFRHGGATVFEDPDSVDLLVQLDGQESIIEVKTITARNLRYRVRLGIGQLFEYQYRRNSEIQANPRLALALSTDLMAGDPLIGFLNGHLNMALVTRAESGEYHSFAPQEDGITALLNR